MGTTVNMEVVDRGERRDGIGRVHVPVERQHELVDAYRTSGLTRRRFARQFCTWVQREDKAAGASGGAAARTKRAGSVVRSARRINFAEVALPGSAGRGLEVCLADGTILRGERVEELAALAQALRD